MGGFVEKKAMEDVAAAKKLKKCGKRIDKKYGHLKTEPSNQFLSAETG